MSQAPNVEGVSLIGVPYDEQSSFMRGAADAPTVLRAALASDSSNAWSELGLEMQVGVRLLDRGDLSLTGLADPHEAIREGASKALERGWLSLFLGGDHSITYPIVQAFADQYPDLELLHFDAHPDLYLEFAGDRLSHACSFARIMEAGLARRLVQVGIRTMNAEQREQAARFAVEVLDMRGLEAGADLEFSGPLYVSFDLDVLDPAFAPGVSHWEPGGLTVREAIRLIHGIRGHIVGADLVELNPRRDPRGLSAMVAAKLCKELAARILVGSAGSS